MISGEALEKLRQHPLVSDFLPKQIDKLAALATEVGFDRDQIVFHEGDESSTFYLIFSGRVALEMCASGRARTIQTLQAGDEMGWSSVLQASQKFFQARTLEPVQAMAFDGPSLIRLCNSDCRLGYKFITRLLHVVAERLQGTQMQLLDVYAPGGAARGG